MAFFADLERVTILHVKSLLKISLLFQFRLNLYYLCKIISGGSFLFIKNDNGIKCNFSILTPSFSGNLKTGNNNININYMNMDIRIISLLTILAFNFSTSFATTNGTFTEIRPVERIMIHLSPSSPGEADFNDLVPEANNSNTIIMPVTPREATFDDDTNQESISEETLLNTLSPSAPDEADFEENT
jgi:hypothetical protein